MDPRAVGACYLAILAVSASAAAAQQVATAPPLAYASGEVTYRLRLHSGTVMSSPDTAGSSTQRDSADVLLTLLFRSSGGAPNDVVGIRVDSTVSTTARWPAPGVPPTVVELPATPRGLQADMEIRMSDGLLQEVVSAFARCLPALPATRASDWRRSLTVRWRAGATVLSSEARDGSWRAQGFLDVTSRGHRVRALRITGRDSVRVTSDGPSGSGTAAMVAVLDTTGVLLSSNCTEQDTLRFQWGTRRIVAAVERRAVLTLAPSQTSTPGPGQAQDSPFEDLHRPEPQPALREYLAAGRVPELRATSNGNADCHASFATSYLTAPGAAPAKPVPPFFENDTNGTYLQWRGRFMRWACQYAPERAYDGDTGTAWVEGAEGVGIGEVLVVPADESCSACPDLRGPLEIWAGFGRSPALHRANARPREIRVYLLRAQRLDRGEGTEESVETFTNLDVVAVRQVVLEDRNGYQALPLPPIPEGEHFLVGLEVQSVYPGARWQDTAITEVRRARP
jgi:hypothetical protein